MIHRVPAPRLPNRSRAPSPGWECLLGRRDPSRITDVREAADTVNHSTWYTNKTPDNYGKRTARGKMPKTKQPQRMPGTASVLTAKTDKPDNAQARQAGCLAGHRPGERHDRFGQVRQGSWIRSLKSGVAALLLPFRPFGRSDTSAPFLILSARSATSICSDASGRLVFRSCVTPGRSGSPTAPAPPAVRRVGRSDAFSAPNLSARPAAE